MNLLWWQAAISNVQPESEPSFWGQNWHMLRVVPRPRNDLSRGARSVERTTHDMFLSEADVHLLSFIKLLPSQEKLSHLLADWEARAPPINLEKRKNGDWHLLCRTSCPLNVNTVSTTVKNKKNIHFSVDEDRKFKTLAHLNISLVS